jgi:hypothetical protein
LVAGSNRNSSGTKQQQQSLDESKVSRLTIVYFEAEIAFPVAIIWQCNERIDVSAAISTTNNVGLNDSQVLEVAERMQC